MRTINHRIQCNIRLGTRGEYVFHVNFIGNNVFLLWNYTQIHIQVERSEDSQIVVVRFSASVLLKKEMMRLRLSKT